MATAEGRERSRAVSVADVALVDLACARVREQMSAEDADVAQRFIRQYYRWVAAEDLATRDWLDVYGESLSHFNLARERTPGTPKVRAYNPNVESHGWQSPHTVVEIVTDDMPFLIDSVVMELNREGFGVHLVIHPVMSVRRDDEGRLLDVLPQPLAADGAVAESVIHVEVTRRTDPAELESMREHLEKVIGEVRAVVEDWPAMRDQAIAIASELAASPPSLDLEDVAEGKAFMEWLENHHFTFLGYREYDVIEDDGEVRLRPKPETGLGILRPGDIERNTQGFDRLPAAVRARALEPYLLNLTKANSRATVHRPAYLDYVGIKRFDDEGRVIGERRFLGLYTSSAYHSSPRDIPILRHKVEAILNRAAFPHDSHNEKALLEILESHPRDELLQTPVDELFLTAMGILHLGERQRLRLFVRRDTFERFLSCLVFVPRDRFNTENRRKIEQILREEFNALSVDYTTRVSESVLVRLHYMVYVEPGTLPGRDVDQIESRLVAATRSWADDLEEALTDRRGEEEGSRLHGLYANAFPTAYRVDWIAAAAVADIGHIESLPADGLDIVLYRPLEAAPGVLRAKLFRSGSPLALSDMLPLFENLGVAVADERPYEVRPRERDPAWIYDFGLAYKGEGDLEAGDVRQSFQDAFVRAWHGDAENDGYNRLVLGARLTWRQVTVLRAVGRFLRQAGTTFSDKYVENALCAHPHVARMLVDLFCARFDPDGADEQDAAELSDRITEAIDAVESLDQDQILRLFLGTVTAMCRTNYFQEDEQGEPKLYLSYKLDPSLLPWLPLPRPQFEIFVYSPRTEGSHLRGGKVARGGLRWSDRREDFRTEVLGLMKAQMVKNAVIVPVGAKGGFVVKRPPADGGREALLEEVVACYRTFIQGLLDITDNIDAGELVPPERVKRYDDDDPYLVVAADKGTATFSDIANGIAAEYGFWLDDAFASGGSTGYDHKGMGITARGAWESVKRHFREMGTDIQSQDFTVAGIGDMSGDVFGNGMLLSEHIRLVAAFDHRHVFIDPDPDTEKSYAERRRLFGLERSSWDDYDRELISEGGGVFPRTAKSVELSAEAREALGTDAESVTPSELIRAILHAPVDLLWNGGIGTYVKASFESEAEAGDKANDAVRVDADELRCKVIGEGGNLGLTQAARIEFALGGGRVNTDAIDNSGGVDCSDREVNIKVLLGAIKAEGDMTEKQRVALLAEMTDEVAALVLKDNYEQSETLTMSETYASSMIDVHARLIRKLESTRKLDRELESLPNEEEIAERKREHRGLTRPELATLLAYSKIDLYGELLDSSVPEDPYLSAELEAYFPEPLRERFGERMAEHRLRREIIATQVANNILHGGGTTFVFRLAEETDTPPSDIARAYTVAREVFQMRQLWGQIEGLDNRVDAEVQTLMLLEGRRLIERSTRWLLRNRRRPLDIASTVQFYGPGAEVMYETTARLLVSPDVEPLLKRVDELESAGVPPELAQQVSSLGNMFSTLDIVDIATESGMDLGTVAAVHFRLGSKLELHWLRDRIIDLPREDRWGALARAALRDDLYGLHRALTAEVLKGAAAEPDPDALVRGWVAAQPAAERALETLADIRVGHNYDLTTLPVAVREVRNLLVSPE